MKSIKYITLASIALLGLASCSDSFLDKNPDERTDIDNELKVSQLLTGAYPDVSYMWLAELSSDNLIDNQAPHLPSSPQDKQVIAHYNYSAYSRYDNQIFAFQPSTFSTLSESDSPEQLWNGYYNSVAMTNYALQAIDKLQEQNGGVLTDRLKAAKGEALMLRAFDHFCLVNVFSQAYKDEEQSKKDVGVPYVKDVEETVQKSYDRSNVYDTYKNIIADMEEALPLISDEYYQAPKYHFNENAAHAFAARVYLYTRQWDKVIEQADQVLGTDSTTAASKLMDYSIFEKASTSTEYATAWQDPELGNNLMLLTTYSLLERRIMGYRYSCAGPEAQKVLQFHGSQLWPHWIVNPLAIISGALFSYSGSDYGYFSTKIGERFEYSDKIARIGYVHTIQRIFTGTELLLERAEAKVMLGRYDDAMNDLQWYWNHGLRTFTTADYSAFVNESQGWMRFLNKNLLLKIYSKATNPNCFENWDFTQNVSSSYVIPAEAVPYMNFLNDFRRYENSFEGLRFFDLKRWGIEYTHVQGLESTPYSIKANDPRLAIEVPWETRSEGMPSSRPTETPLTKTMTMPNPSMLVNK